ncbi:Hsp20/alpha crystallin family protein [Haloarcula onubensis]|uniref:Hsp20/alpha crystallin family protein n=1 Tax=Haloarcula onubensis TaxID=2950539 RepID=A0ABU2FTB9_9EURY|nr:Hsp20/alpha crystallin family protein [Halomicroarcula sp. S3CR25-11]MDS0284013.1 Hsp20/alpha crystallin family protein [Halomicroarcula sp. S3CR25-11]
MDRQSPLDSMESWFEQMSKQFETAADRWGTGIEPWGEGMDQPRIDLAEDGEQYTIVADIPGFGKDDIEVYVTDNTLAIEAEQREEMVTEEANYIQQERTHQSLSRRITLPSDADTDDISASMADGVLTITVARVEPLDSGHQIDIE